MLYHQFQNFIIITHYKLYVKIHTQNSLSLLNQNYHKDKILSIQQMIFNQCVIDSKPNIIQFNYKIVSMQLLKQSNQLRIYYHGVQSILHVDPKSTLTQLKSKLLYYKWQSQLQYYHFRYHSQNNHTLVNQNICINKLSNYYVELYKQDQEVQMICTKDFLIYMMNINHLFQMDSLINVKPLSIQQIENCQNLYEILGLSLMLENPLISNGFNQNIVIKQNQLKFLLDKINLKISSTVQMHCGIYHNMQYKQLKVEREFVSREIEKLSDINILDWVTKMDRISGKSFQEINKISKKQWLINILSRIDKLRSAMNVKRIQISLQSSKNLSASVNLINKFKLCKYYIEQQKQYLSQLTYRIVKDQVFSGEISLATQEISNLKNNPFCKIQNLCQKDINFYIRQIRKSKQRMKYGNIHATNSITFLVMHSYIFQYLDFSKINISGADLSQGVFIKVKFDEANLSSCNLSGTIFQGCSFTKAQVTNIQSSDFVFKLSNYAHRFEQFEVYQDCLYLLYIDSIIVISLITKRIIKTIYLNFYVFNCKEFKIVGNLFLISSFMRLMICNLSGKNIMQIVDIKQNSLTISNQNAVIIVDKNNCVVWDLETFKSTGYQIDITENVKLFKISEFDGDIYISNNNHIVKYNKNKKQTIKLQDAVKGFLISNNKIYCITESSIQVYDLIQNQFQNSFKVMLNNEQIYQYQMFQNRYLNIVMYTKSIVVDIKQQKVYYLERNHQYRSRYYFWNGIFYHIIQNGDFIKLIPINSQNLKGFTNKQIECNSHLDKCIMKNVLQQKILDCNNQQLFLFSQLKKISFLHNEILNILFAIDQNYVYILDTHEGIKLISQFDYKRYVQDIVKKNIGGVTNIRNGKNHNLYVIFQSYVIILKYPQYTSVQFQNILSNIMIFIDGQERDQLLLKNSNDQIIIFATDDQEKYQFQTYFCKLQRISEDYDQIHHIYTIQTNQLIIKFQLIFEQSYTLEIDKVIKNYYIAQNHIIIYLTQKQLTTVNMLKNKQKSIEVQNFRIEQIKIVNNSIYCLGYSYDNVLALYLYDLDGNHLTQYTFPQVSFKLYSVTIFQRSIYLANMNRQVYCFEFEDNFTKYNLKQLKFQANIKQICFYKHNYVFLDHFSKYYVYDSELNERIMENSFKKRIVDYCSITNQQKYIYQFSAEIFQIFNNDQFTLQTYELPFASQIQCIKLNDNAQYAVILYMSSLIVVFDLKNNNIIRKIIQQNIGHLQITQDNHIHIVATYQTQQISKVIHYKECLYEKNEIIQLEDIQSVLDKYKLSNSKVIQINKKYQDCNVNIYDCLVDNNQKESLKLI